MTTVDFESMAESGRTAYLAESKDYWMPHKRDPLAQLRDDAVREMGGRFVREKSITRGKHPGQEIYIGFDDDNVCRLRLFLVKERFYRVSICGMRAAVMSKAADRFLDSFKLLE